MVREVQHFIWNRKSVQTSQNDFEFFDTFSIFSSNARKTGHGIALHVLMFTIEKKFCDCIIVTAFDFNVPFFSLSKLTFCK